MTRNRKIGTSFVRLMQSGSRRPNDELALDLYQLSSTPTRNSSAPDDPLYFDGRRMSWLKNSGRSKDRKILKNVKRESRSFGEFNHRTVSLD